MPEYTVLHAEHKKAIDGKHGPMQVIALRLSDGTTEHDAEWFTKATTEVPAANTRMEGTLEAGQYGIKFKKAYNAPGSGGRPRDPRESAAIQRQHSQEMALRYATIQAARGVLPDDWKLGEALKAIIDWFDDDIAGGVERKHPTPGMVKGLPVRNEPQHTGAPEATTPSADYATPPGEHPDVMPWQPGLENT